MPELRIIIDGTTRLCALYHESGVPALARIAELLSGAR